VRVGDVIEHDQRAIGLGVLCDLFKAGFIERLGLEHYALVHGVGAKDAIERTWEDTLWGDLAIGKNLTQPVLRVLSHEQAVDLTVRVDERGLNGVHAKEPDDPFVALGPPIS
jgi:hypothetical protein